MLCLGTVEQQIPLLYGDQQGVNLQPVPQPPTECAICCRTFGLGLQTTWLLCLNQVTRTQPELICTSHMARTSSQQGLNHDVCIQLLPGVDHDVTQCTNN